MSQFYQIKLVSVLLPTYNEAENISLLIYAISKTIKYPFEIIVVDDNSPDGTSDIVQKLADSNKTIKIRCITRCKNPGLTNSLKRGIKEAKGDVIVWLDCDFSMPPEMIPKMLLNVEKGYDIVVGSRFIRGGKFKQVTQGKKDSLIAVILSRIMNYTIRYFLGTKFHDYTSGFIAIKSSILSRIRLRGDYGEYFIDLIYKALVMNYKILEMPYICLPREKGESKTGRNIWQYLKRGKEYIKLTFRLLYERYIRHNLI